MRTCLRYLVALCASVLLTGKVTQAASPVTFFGVTKLQPFIQTNDTAPVIRSAGGYRGEAFVFSTAPTTAGVRNPINVLKPLTNSGGYLTAFQTFGSLGGLAVQWPNGNYSLEITNSTDGSKRSV